MSDLWHKKAILESDLRALHSAYESQVKASVYDTFIRELVALRQDYIKSTADQHNINQQDVDILLGFIDYMIEVKRRLIKLTETKLQDSDLFSKIFLKDKDQVIYAIRTYQGVKTGQYPNGFIAYFENYDDAITDLAKLLADNDFIIECSVDEVADSGLKYIQTADTYLHIYGIGWTGINDGYGYGEFAKAYYSDIHKASEMVNTDY